MCPSVPPLFVIHFLLVSIHRLKNQTSLVCHNSMAFVKLSFYV